MRCKNNIHFVYTALTLFALMLGGCGGPRVLKIAAEAGPELNPDGNGDPLSLVVHVHQLRSSEAFKRISLDTLAAGKSEQELLGKTLVSSREILLLPNEKAEDQDAFSEETRFIGVIGLFRQGDRNYWRLLFPIDALKKDTLSFAAGPCFLSAKDNRNQALPGQSEQAPLECRGKAD